MKTILNLLLKLVELPDIQDSVACREFMRKILVMAEFLAEKVPGEIDDETV